MKIVFATNNKHKLSEVRAVLGEGYELVTLAEVGITEDIPETGDTLDENMSAQVLTALPTTQVLRSRHSTENLAYAQRAMLARATTLQPTIANSSQPWMVAAIVVLVSARLSRLFVVVWSSMLRVSSRVILPKVSRAARVLATIPYLSPKVTHAPLRT